MTRDDLAVEISKGLTETINETTENKDIPKMYAEWLEEVGSLKNPRCIIYAGMWCPFSQLLVTNFLIKAESHGKDLNSLRQIYELFKEDFAAEILCDERKEDFAKRARLFLNYVGDLDLSQYDVEEYDKAGEWI